MSDSSFAILLQHYMIRVQCKSQEIATVMNDTSKASFRHHALQPAGQRLPGQPGLSAYAEVFTSHSLRPWVDIH